MIVGGSLEEELHQAGDGRSRAQVQLVNERAGDGGRHRERRPDGEARGQRSEVRGGGRDERRR